MIDYINNKFKQLILITKNDYITKDSIIIFSHNFNKKLDIKLLSNYKQIIFSSYELHKKLFDAYANDTFIKFNFKSYYNLFNQSVDLSSILICSHLTFGDKFNK